MSAIGEVLSRGTLPAWLRLGATGASTGRRVARNIARWTVTTILVLACGLGTSRAVEDFMARGSWSAAGRSLLQSAQFNGPWFVQVGLILALIFKWRRAGLVLAAATLTVLAYEPLSHWASFTDMPGSAVRFYLLYLATVLAVFPVFYRPAPRHGRPTE